MTNQKRAYSVEVFGASGRKIALYVIPQKLQYAAEEELNRHTANVLEIHNQNIANDTGTTTKITFVE